MTSKKEMEMMPKKYIVLPAHHVYNVLRLPAMWAECVGDVKEAEEIAKELELNWVDHISHLYYDQDIEVEMVAFKLLDSINNSTGSHWGTEDVCW